MPGMKLPSLPGRHNKYFIPRSKAAGGAMKAAVQKLRIHVMADRNHRDMQACIAIFVAIDKDARYAVSGGEWRAVRP
jgi:hypothetical protein